MITALMLSVAITAPPSEGQLELLKTFHRELVAITPGDGEFPPAVTMGHTDGGEPSERPAHQVTLRYKFHIARFETPQNLWQAVMGDNPSRWKGERNAVEWISHGEAVEFCRRLTRLMRQAELIRPTEAIRLPSEAEWEYVARAGTKTLYSFGGEAKGLDEFAWHTGNAAGNDPPVGAKKPNPWGLYDIHGYLWEWCADTWHKDYGGAPADGSVWTDGGDAQRRVMRGGSWKDPAERLTSSFRRGVSSGLRDDAVGFRCLLAEEPDADR